MQVTLSEHLLPAAMSQAVTAALNHWDAAGNTARLWARDSSLWTSADEARWLGWLDIVDRQLGNLDHLHSIARLAQTGGFTGVAVLGMGGSSLAPEVLAMTLGSAPGFPRLSILDSTDPAQIHALDHRLDPGRTLFLVASKSGSTLEPNVFHAYFWDRVQKATGDAGSRFVAITDPGSQFEQVARRDGFRAILHGVPEIGGRFSALSNFGMTPAAAIGVDVADFLERARQMVRACGAGVPAAQNPGVALGTVLGTLGRQGRDKITLIASPALSDLGAWLEQLLAESTGKRGQGLIPVDREPLGDPAVYGGDRLFVYIRHSSGADPDQEARVRALADAGQPVVRIAVEDLRNLGQEFFRWEIATAVAGHYLGINPFDQPDVEASKIATRAITTEYEANGALTAEAPLFEQDGIQVFADPANAAALRDRAGDSLGGWLRAHINRVQTGDYFAILAYLEMHAKHEELLTSLRVRVRDGHRVATCVGFGPRFLHSTGQAYKGGPNSGVFLQITADSRPDLPIPGRRYTFGTVKAAQALGDLQVLAERKRRALRIHLTGDITAALSSLVGSIG